MGKFLFWLGVIIVIIGALIASFIYFVPAGQKRFIGDIFLGIMCTILLATIPPLLFNKLMKIQGQTNSFTLIIMAVTIPLLFFSFFNDKGRFYAIKLDCDQESQFETLKNNIINQHSFLNTGLDEHDSINQEELSKLKKIKPLNQKRKQQKQAIINKVNKFNNKIKKQNSSQNGFQ
ncbi:hypothetical protein ACQW5G_08705 (plasmid) [Fructilactobacillus sp. Tb1]|uniref:hypothetical protein n=1 Tax=Fructilactobacillus sp. Tb1 TaxID=3422304 RepID=UPI003D27599F